MVLDSIMCGSLTRIELLYLSENGWYAKDIQLNCGGVLYGVLGSTCIWFDLNSDTGNEALHTYELVCRAELSRCLLINLHLHLAPSTPSFLVCYSMPCDR